MMRYSCEFRDHRLSCNPVLSIAVDFVSFVGLDVRRNMVSEVMRSRVLCNLEAVQEN
jgi:hypothetical protein